MYKLSKFDKTTLTKNMSNKAQSMPIQAQNMPNQAQNTINMVVSRFEVPGKEPVPFLKNL